MAFTPKKRKTLEAAQKYAQKGSYDKALREYDKLLKADPSDTNIRLKIGDLYLKKGDKAKAIESYAQVAEQFSKGGFDAKAVAIYKQILRADPECLEARIRLGEHFQRMGLNSDALREFQEAVRLCQEREMKREALDLLKKVASLDPGNVPNRLNLAELFLREKLVDEAKSEYESLLDEVQRQTATDLVVRVAEHALGAFPEHRRALEMLANAKISLREPQEAIRLLTSAQHRFPDDLRLLESLVLAHGAAGDEDGKQRAYREMAEIHKRRGDNEKAREIMQRFVVSESFAADDDYTSPSIILTDETMGDLSLDLPEPEFGSDKDLTDPTGSTLTPRRMAKLPVRDLSPPDPGTDLTSSSDLIAEAKVALEFGDPETAARLAKQAAETDPGSAELQSLLSQLEKSNTPGVDALANQLEAAGIGAIPEARSGTRPTTRAPAPPMPEAKRPAPPAPAAKKPAPPAPAAKKPEAPEPAAKKPEAPEREVPREADPAPPKPAAQEPAPKKDLPLPSTGEDSMDELPDVEIVLADDSDDDPSYASVEPPDELAFQPLDDTESSGAVDVPEPAPPAAQKAEPAPPDEASVDIDVEIDVDLDLDDGEFELDMGEVTPSEPAVGESALFGESDADGTQDWNDDASLITSTLADADAMLADGDLDGAEERYRLVLERIPNHPQAMLRLGEIEQRRAAEAPQPAEPEAAPAAAPAPELELEPAVPESPAEPAPQASEPALVLDDDDAGPPSIPEFLLPPEVTTKAEDTIPPLEQELAEASFVDDAATCATPLDTLAPEPEPPGGFVDLGLDLGLDEDAAVEGIAEPGDEDAFDLAAELEAELESGGTSGAGGQVAFDEVFSAFKKGIQEQVGEEEVDAHYDLAIAYREMGLFEDAVRELEIVMRGGARVIESLSLMAHCKVEMGLHDQALGHLNAALGAVPDDDPTRVALRYDIGEVQLSAGNRAEALSAFQAVAVVDKDFRDVQERIKELQ